MEWGGGCVWRETREGTLFSGSKRSPPGPNSPARTGSSCFLSAQKFAPSIGPGGAPARPSGLGGCRRPEGAGVGAPRAPSPKWRLEQRPGQGTWSIQGEGSGCEPRGCPGPSGPSEGVFGGAGGRGAGRRGPGALGDVFCSLQCVSSRMRPSPQYPLGPCRRTLRAGTRRGGGRRDPPSPSPAPAPPLPPPLLCSEPRDRELQLEIRSIGTRDHVVRGWPMTRPPGMS